MITTKRTIVGRGTVIWFAYRDGEMLRDKSGIGRRFKSQQAAEMAALAESPANPLGHEILRD
jgi:hypothetical protein